MENQEKGLTVNIGEYKGEKPIEVVYRIGKILLVDIVRF